MSDDQYKVKKLRGLSPVFPAIGGLAPNTVMRWSPTRAVMSAQDALVATTRRVLARVGLSGSDDWSVPDDTAGDPNNAGGAQLFPDSDWRIIKTVLANLTPGAEMEARVMYSGAGTVQKDSGGGFFIHDGAWGEIRFRCTWTNGVNTSGPHSTSFTMPGSGLGTYGGGEVTAAGAEKNALRRKHLIAIQIPDFSSDPAVASNFSEWSEVEIEIAVRGAPRIISAVVYEMPRSYTKLDTVTSTTSLHCTPPSLAPLVPMPLESTPDPATWDENRFSVAHMVSVCERQTERLGPRIWDWSSYDEDQALNWLDTEQDPFTTSSATNVDIVNTSLTSWAATNPGFVVYGCHAKLHRLNEPVLISRNEFAVIPVRVRVDASQSAGTGTVRIQASACSWVEVSITGGRAVYEQTGYLECAVHADHDWGTAQAFARCTAGTLSIWNVAIDYGTF